jgi:hypothetical protein
MVQPIQQGGQPAVQQPAPAAVPAGQQPVQPVVEKKKSKWWIWVIVAVVIIGIAIGAYFFIF